MDQPPFAAPPGWHWIFRPWFRHWRTGAIVRRPNGRPFAFLVKD
jgi:hypothetical protein